METTLIAPPSTTTLKDLLQAIWKQRAVTIGIIGLTVFGSVLAVLLSPKVYEATVVLSVVSRTLGDNQSSGLRSLVASLGDVVGLAGGALNESKKGESLAVLQSELLTTRFIREKNLIPILYRDELSKQELDPTKKNTAHQPSLWKASRYFRKSVSATKTDNKSGLVTLTIKWNDPKIAAAWANDIVAMANEQLRMEAIQESERNLVFLNEQVGKTEIVGIKQLIYTLIQTEIGKEMLARGAKEYAFKVIDPAVAPEKPASPQPLAWILLGLVLGIVIALTVVFVRLAWEEG